VQSSEEFLNFPSALRGGFLNMRSETIRKEFRNSSVRICVLWSSDAEAGTRFAILSLGARVMPTTFIIKARKPFSVDRAAHPRDGAVGA
jgi:hypothetical protein